MILRCFLRLPECSSLSPIILTENAEKDFGSINIATVQKCVRTGDIDEVGDEFTLLFLKCLEIFLLEDIGKKKL